jgi:uncharacterized membrane protein
MTLDERLRTSGDLYLCLAASILLGLAAALGWKSTSLPGGAWGAIQPAAGFAMLLLPGYACGTLVGLDRRGIEVLAGVGVALSLAIMALMGSAVWLLTRSFSIRGLEGLLAGFLLILTCGALWQRKRFAPASDAIQTRWAALGIIAVPLALAVAMIGRPGSASPATRFTEFSLVSVKPALVVAVANHEASPKTYRVVARLGATVTRTQSFVLQPGQRRQSRIDVPEQQSGLVRLYLHVEGKANTMKLWVWRPAILPQVPLQQKART